MNILLVMMLTATIVAVITVFYIFYNRRVCSRDSFDDDDDDDSKYNRRSTVKIFRRKQQRVNYTAQKSTDPKHLVKCKKLLKKFPMMMNKPIGPYGLTPFLRACAVGGTRLVRHMLSSGADISSRTDSGAGPLYLAVYAIATKNCDDFGLLEALIDAGCDVNAAKRSGFAPLHVAARFGNEELVRWLLVNGADPLPEGCPQTPYDLAIVYGHQEVAELLRVNTGTREFH